MKKLNLFTFEGKRLTYLIDDLLSIGAYITTTTEYLNKNDELLLKSYNLKNNQFHRIKDAVLIHTKDKDNTRIDFLITEDVCFESLELISTHGFGGKFYDEFSTAFEMLDTNQYEDEIWYH